ncbi:helix-turn-helix transcriptional regulator [Kribbella italica]|uniref:AraC family L-rhamnose operon transcriptional activator RhaR n=1 Tax=Kribbella italica TaxID=1540520 RepID=A0A7W9J728_9ACTN|nr:helix-turn-helix domain-containing protein [Kribbella italica]MBB5836812.1 AraC family L-rhamnose operon transcriptional activator RhaR [Kribbella italica]
MPETLHEANLFQGGPVWGGVHRLTSGVDAHAHDFLEIAVIGPGAGRHRTSQGDQPVRRGQVLVLRPGAWHAFTHCRDLVVANCCVSARGLRAELSALQQIPLLRDLLWTTPSTTLYGVATTQVDPAAADAAIAQITHLTEDLAAAPTAGIPGRLLGHLVTVLGLLADGLPSTPAAPAVHPAVAAAITRLETDLAAEWRLEDLAGAANLDPAYLGRLFKHDTGLSPLAYLARLRAEQAALLLTDSTLPASRVGAAVGWPDPTYFARRFRTLVGLTPTEYRASQASTG